MDQCTSTYLCRPFLYVYTQAFLMAFNGPSPGSLNLEIRVREALKVFRSCFMQFLQLALLKINAKTFEIRFTILCY